MLRGERVGGLPVLCVRDSCPEAAREAGLSVQGAFCIFMLSSVIVLFLASLYVCCV